VTIAALARLHDCSGFNINLIHAAVMMVM